MNTSTIESQNDLLNSVQSAMDKYKEERRKARNKRKALKRKSKKSK